MEITDAKAFLGLLRAEWRRRQSLIADMEDDGSGYAYDQWIFTDLPFLYDLCLLYLVALRHHVERQLFLFVIKATEDGLPISRVTFEKRERYLGNLQPRERWKEIKRRLKPEEAVHYRSIEGLRLLANSYKHEQGLQPSNKLINHLRLSTQLTYASMPESFALKDGLAQMLGLPNGASYDEITERFVQHADAFLKDVGSRNNLSKVRWGRISLTNVAH